MMFQDMPRGSLRFWISSVAVVAALTVALVLAASSSSKTPVPSAAGQEAPFKVGVIFDGSIHDGGYDQSAYNGIKAAIQRVGTDKATFTYAQQVPYTSQMTQVVNGMISNGAKLIIDMAAGAGLVFDACKQHPDVQCLEVNGFPPLANNVQAFYPKNFYTDYLTGVAAGLVTKTGKLGFAASFKIPTPIFESINSVALGCQSVRPDCKVLVSYVNSWYNPPKETSLFNTLGGAGADVLLSYSNDAVPVQVAEKRGIWGVGIFGDQRKFGPHSYLTTRLVDWSQTFEKYIRSGIAGHVTGGGVDLWGVGPRLHLGSFGKRVPAAVKQKVNKIAAQMQAGKSPFTGPIYDQSGKLRVKKGQRLSDDFIYSKWNWLVKGVVATK
jgi:simple sugar transport system substrate-binding protein